MEEDFPAFTPTPIGSATIFVRGSWRCGDGSLPLPEAPSFMGRSFWRRYSPDVTRRHSFNLVCECHVIFCFSTSRRITTRATLRCNASVQPAGGYKSMMIALRYAAVPVWSGHLPSWANLITTTSGVRLSVHTTVLRRAPQRQPMTRAVGVSLLFLRPAGRPDARHH